jgi:RluA family pseudouridine synthase
MRRSRGTRGRSRRTTPARDSRATFRTRGGPPAPEIAFVRWIAWEDEDLIAVDKPAGVLSQGGEDAAAPNLVDLARTHLRVQGVGVLHRVDRNVSGLVLIAKNARAASAMARLFREGAVTREYRAIVRGRPARHAFALDAWLAKDARTREVHAVSEAELARMSDAARRTYRPARTEVEVLQTFRAPIGACAELSLRPITGRSHQLRAHLAHAGLPIVGDPKYGVLARDLHRPLLHATHLAFTHPLTHEPVSVDAPIPWNEARLRSLTGRAPDRIRTRTR